MQKTRNRATAAVLVILLLAAILLLSGMRGKSRDQEDLTAEIAEGVAWIKRQESRDPAAVEEQINALEEENARLLIEHEAAYSAARVEEYAREALGMQSPASGQIVYIESGDADWAEIPASEP